MAHDNELHTISSDGSELYFRVKRLCGTSSFGETVDSDPIIFDSSRTYTTYHGERKATTSQRAISAPPTLQRAKKATRILSTRSSQQIPRISTLHTTMLCTLSIRSRRKSRRRWMRRLLRKIIIRVSGLSTASRYTLIVALTVLSQCAAGMDTFECEFIFVCRVWEGRLTRVMT